MNKKAFTLIELLAVVLILGMLATIATASYHKFTMKAEKESFQMAEKTLINDVKNAYADCLGNSINAFCDNHQSFGYQNETVYLKDLIENGYSEKIKNPYNTDSYCDENLSYVKVTSSGVNANNMDVSYTVCLICGDKKSDSCSNE